MTLIRSKNYLAPRPSKKVLFLRQNLLWQIYRFIVINLKMTQMILRSHGGKNLPRQENEK